MPIAATSPDLDRLIRDLHAVHRELMPEVRQVASKGGLNIKRDWSGTLQGHRSIVHLPRAINYDIAEGPDWVEVEVGPDHARLQGNMGHLIEFGEAEYGSLRNAPIPGGQLALDAEAPRFERALANVGHRVLARHARP